MNYKRMLIFFAVLLLAAFLYHYMLYIRRYNAGYSFYTVSNALFLVGVIGFFPSLMAQLGTYRFFYGFQFAIRSLISSEFRSKFKTLTDYTAGKKSEMESSLYVELMIASGILLSASIALAMFWDRALW